MTQLTRALTLSLLFLAPSFRARAEETAAPAGIRWEAWSDAAFERARREDRLVLLDLEAVWCHWCHVMDEITYRDPEVVALLRDRFVAIKVDQDSRPDLSNRYEDYGWPATILLDAKGNDLARRSGYIPPKPMASMLRAFLLDPTPGPSVTNARAAAGPAPSAPPLPAGALLGELERSWIEQFDFEKGSWGTVHKFLHPDSLEYTLRRAAEGDARAEAMARQTLDASLALHDPVWGGVYQYSTGGGWKEPHFEKIMWVQADNLRLYALASAQLAEPRYLEAARRIHGYLTGFLRGGEGAFYTSQDADVVKGEHSEGYFALDDAGRRARGMPRVDTHLYARENGWAIQAIATLYGVTGERRYLDDAERAARWILSHRSLGNGGFSHGERSGKAETGGPYLGDTLAMGQAFLALHAVTGEREWLKHAEAAARFTASTFRAESGYVTVKGGRPQRDETIDLVRFANTLSRYTGKEEHRSIAAHARAWLLSPDVARLLPTGGALLAEAESARDPLHVTVVGRKSDALARELFRAAAALPGGYKRVEWWDPREGPLPNADVEYPELPTSAAFLCVEGRCSAPARTVGELRTAVVRLGARAPAATY